MSIPKKSQSDMVKYKKDRECGDCVYFWDCHYEHAGVISPHEDFEPMCEE